MGERSSEAWGREAGRWGKRNEGKKAEEKGGVRVCREEPVGRAGKSGQAGAGLQD